MDKTTNEPIRGTAQFKHFRDKVREAMLRFGHVQMVDTRHKGCCSIILLFRNLK